MEILSKISPAATLLLITTSARLRSLLKLTLMDLVLKGVLKLEIKSQSLQQAHRQIAVWYVCQGKNFKGYRPKPYELIFLQPFYEEPVRITFRDVVRVGFRNAGGIDIFKRSVIKAEGLDPYLKRSFLQRMYGGHSLTNEGKSLQMEIKSYLLKVDRSIGQLLQQDHKAALDVLISMRGNILLLKKLQYKMIENINYAQLMQNHEFNVPADWRFYESMFEDCHWLDYFDLNVDVKNK